MQIRILHIRGRTPSLRGRRLEAARKWMERHGWRMTDFSPEADSALFERAEGAGRAPFWHPTRWWPGPRGWHGVWGAGGGARSPRAALLAGGVAVVAVGVFVALLAFTYRAPPGAGGGVDGDGAAGETWRYVTADSLNVRAEGRAGAQIVGVFFRNQRVLVEEVADGWARVTRPEWGYVAADYLSDHPAR